uniref:Uncharacterized protein n=1 Tax=Arundo donax TaxID=35708 RepID=A0A0A9DT70_ARUDO
MKKSYLTSFFHFPFFDASDILFFLSFLETEFFCM